ncbi:hypothetical protein FHX81_0453 [Saccharothrix saharensis]|uniref:Uncharacterized protein n=1 Tax=Saccharothrix saharensis TaxID=571190 RepID=A0A543J5X0_9PSEU|nr:hypothetical protein FHX81_0453 [Saccharothrix saharensis]
MAGVPCRHSHSSIVDEPRRPHHPQGNTDQNRSKPTRTAGLPTPSRRRTRRPRHLQHHQQVGARHQRQPRPGLTQRTPGHRSTDCRRTVRQRTSPQTPRIPDKLGNTPRRARDSDEPRRRDHPLTRRPRRLPLAHDHQHIHTSSYRDSPTRTARLVSSACRKFAYKPVELRRRLGGRAHRMRPRGLRDQDLDVAAGLLEHLLALHPSQHRLVQVVQLGLGRVSDVAEPDVDGGDVDGGLVADGEFDAPMDVKRLRIVAWMCRQDC